MKTAKFFIAAFFLMVLSMAENTEATLLWRGDFETGDISQWSHVNCAFPGTGTVILSDGGAREGKYYAKLTATNQHCNTADYNERVMLYHDTKIRGDQIGDLWYSTSIKFDNNWKWALNEWIMIFNTATYSENRDYVPLSNPSFSFMYEKLSSGTLRATITHHGIPSHPAALAPPKLGVWHDYILHIKWTTGTNGLYELWHREEGGAFSLVWSVYNVQTDAAKSHDAVSESIYFTNRIYRGTNIAPLAQTIYFDNNRIGTTRADVEYGGSSAPLPSHCSNSVKDADETGKDCGGSCPACSEGQAPYGGTAKIIPGTIQAEDFDTGGEGVAYHDTDPANQGGQYRAGEGVDTKATTDAGVDYKVGWAYSGEWLEYAVNVGSSGTYNLDARVSSAGQGGTFHIEFDGVDKTGPISVPDTGGWDVWQTVTKSGISLTSGQHMMRIVFDTIGPSTATCNLNYVRLSQSSASPSTTSLTLKPGWNQISSAVAAGIDLATIEQSCTVLQYKNQKLWSWNAQAQSWINPAKVEPLKGYWIYVAYVCTVPLSGTPATFNSLQLYSGWNKVSAQGSLSAISGTCANHIVGNWIWNWDKATERWIHPAEMQLDKGYWIKVDTDCVLGG